MIAEDVLRNAVLMSGFSVNAVAKAADVPQSVLDKFVRRAGTINLPTAQKLMSWAGLELRPREENTHSSR